MCRSRRELSKEYLLAKIGVDTAENEPLEVWVENSIQYSIVSLEATPPGRQITVARIRLSRLLQHEKLKRNHELECTEKIEMIRHITADDIRF